MFELPAGRDSGEKGNTIVNRIPNNLGRQLAIRRAFERGFHLRHEIGRNSVPPLH